ncbi:MAG: MMPL family transporter [Actinomycetota bacterium]|nr:MMPL family transporter [Actinomycetota bacterium]
MESWTRLVLRYRWAVVGGWALVFVVSAIAMSALSDLLTNRFALPGTDTARAEKILEDEFGQKSTGSFSLVVRGDSPGSSARLVPRVQSAAERASSKLPTSRVASVQPVSDQVVTATIVSNLDPADAKGYTDDMRRAAGDIPGAELFVSGQAAIEHDLDPVFARDLRVGELFIAIPIALLILVFVFGTLAVVIPFLFAAAAIPATLGIVWIVANYMELTTYLQNLVMLIGFGIAIDYSLLVVDRYREELRAGRSREDAVVATMQTAGRAVVFSGSAVGIGLALMLFMPLPFMRGFGVGGLIIPLVSVMAAVTLLPVLLYLLAKRLDRVRLLPRVVTLRRESEESMWSRLARSIMRRPLRYAAATSAALLALALPVLSLDLGPGSNKGIPQDLEGVRGLNLIGDVVGEGALAPTTIVIDTGRPGGARAQQVQAAVRRLTSGLERDREVARVDFGEGPQHVEPDGRYLRVDVVGKSEYGAPGALEFVDRLRDGIVPAARFPGGVDVFAGGGPPSGVDFLDQAYGAFPWLVLGVLLLTYVLLLRAFRSVILPLKAIVLNLLSIAAAYGVLTAFFSWGAAERVGLIGFDQIEGWIPIFIFAMVFGLSMDYEVFLVSRMREEWDRTTDNEYAVSTGLAKTGRIVTAAGLIMFAAFMGFVAGSVVGLQQFGFGLAMAIILDVTVVRALLVPSAMKLFGRWNWWLPGRVARVFRVKPSPLERKPAPAMSVSGR